MRLTVIAAEPPSLPVGFRWALQAISDPTWLPTMSSVGAGANLALASRHQCGREPNRRNQQFFHRPRRYWRRLLGFVANVWTQPAPGSTAVCSQSISPNRRFFQPRDTRYDSQRLRWFRPLVSGLANHRHFRWSHARRCQRQHLPAGRRRGDELHSIKPTSSLEPTISRSERTSPTGGGNGRVGCGTKIIPVRLTVGAGTLKLGNAGALGGLATHTSGLTVKRIRHLRLRWISRPTYSTLPIILNSSAKRL